MADLDCAGRNLRVFETGDPAILMILEKAEAGRTEYGIERDEGLVADLSDEPIAVPGGAVHGADGEGAGLFF